MAVQDKFFDSKNAYLFKKNENVSHDYLVEELAHQLRNLEVMWLEVFSNHPDTVSPLSPGHRLELENVSFRLKEIIRFIKQNEGPKIIEFVCSEIDDLIAEKFVMEVMISQEEFSQVSVILTVMNVYFQPDMLKMQIIDIQTISNDLKNAVNSLLERLL